MKQSNLKQWTPEDIHLQQRLLSLRNFINNNKSGAKALGVDIFITACMGIIFGLIAWFLSQNLWVTLMPLALSAIVVGDKIAKLWTVLEVLKLSLWEYNAAAKELSNGH